MRPFLFHWSRLHTHPKREGGLLRPSPLQPPMLTTCCRLIFLSLGVEGSQVSLPLSFRKTPYKRGRPHNIVRPPAFLEFFNVWSRTWQRPRCVHPEHISVQFDSPQIRHGFYQHLGLISRKPHMTVIHNNTVVRMDTTLRLVNQLCGAVVAIRQDSQQIARNPSKSATIDVVILRSAILSVVGWRDAVDYYASEKSADLVIVKAMSFSDRVRTAESMASRLEFSHL